MSRQTNIVICFLIVALLAISCSARKKLVDSTTQPQAFEWLSANLDIDAESHGASFNNLKGQMRMRNDSLIWLSVTATMGVEVARMKISTDSAWVVNRLDKSYLAEPLDTLSIQLGRPVSIGLAQAFLFDNTEGLPPTENQTVLLKIAGSGEARVKYSNIKLKEKTTFPLKVTDKMQRVKLKTKR